MSSTGNGGGAKKHRPLSKNPKIINPNRVAPKGSTHLRDKSTIQRLQMYKSKAHYDDKGNFLGGDFMSRTTEKPVSRIAPNPRWFGNTRVIGQSELEEFREQMAAKVNDPYTVVLKRQKLPMALIDLEGSQKQGKVDLLAVESFSNTFGPKAQRKRANNTDFAPDISTLMRNIQEQEAIYNEEKLPGDVQNVQYDPGTLKDDVLQKKLQKGTSKRIWNELYKVIDSSDVLIQVLDARDPIGTRCKRIEDELKTRERRHKHMVLVLNKCDLVPVWVTRAWIAHLSQEYPTIAMHASITNPFGKNALLQVLRQLSKLHSDKKQISVGFVGYPNVGKSSLINTLMGSVVCTAAPVPGETKHWRYVTLFKRVFLIDCPGVVPPNHTSHIENVLKGAVRIEQLDDPVEYIGPLMAQLRPEYIANQYGIPAWSSPEDFVELFCRRTGKLLKGGDADMRLGARMILTDWLMGRLPHFNPPPHRAHDWVQLSGEKYDGPDNMKMTIDEEGNEVPAFAPSRNTLKAQRTANARERKRKAVQQANKTSSAQEDGDDDDEDEDAEFYTAATDIVIDPAPEGEVGVFEDDGLNTDDDDDDDNDADDLKYQNALKQYQNIEGIDKRQNRIERGINANTVDWQAKEWKTLTVRGKYRNADLSEEAFMRNYENKLKNEKTPTLDEDGNEIKTPFGAQSYHPNLNIVQQGDLEELDSQGKSTKDGTVTEGYVVTLLGGKTVTRDGTEGLSKEDIKTMRLFSVQPKEDIKAKQRAIQQQENTLKRPTGQFVRPVNANDDAPSQQALKNREKKKKQRARLRLQGRW